MIIQIYSQPNLFLETADLVCAYVNGIEPKYLTDEGACYVPAPEITKMMEAVCGEIDLSSSRIKLYFRSYKLEENGDTERRPICIGGLLLNTCIEDNTCDSSSMREYLHGSYLGTGKPYRINSFGAAGFGWDRSQEYCTISEELDKHAMPDGLRLRMAETLAAYHHHVDQLCDLLEPLVKRLRPLLEPWVENLQPQIEQWRVALNTEEKQRDFRSRFNINLDEVRRIVMRPRIFYPGDCNGFYTQSDVLYCNAGIGLRIGQAKKPTLATQELAALRQLSGIDRIEMLHIMVGQNMGPRELARRLGINPGTAFRDLNSMYQAHLLKIVPERNGRTYITDLDFIKQMVKRLVEYIERGT